ncbi:MAG TPA: replication-associated recombination protein A [Thermoanaerobaculia bacterium]|nr:replication-associated recombination protein A [Thermoanaerobaculia bacterium]
MNENRSLFGDERPAETDDAPGAGTPLAERMRPRSLEEVVGLEELLGPGRFLRIAIESDRIPSMIFWGPPGSGKTTLARIIARSTRSHFTPFSAVTSGIKEVKAIMEQAKRLRRSGNRRTIVFVDEIHRFNRAQQDAFLPYVESGDIVLIGATTENPSFEVNGALLSRCKVVVLPPLEGEQILTILRRALEDPAVLAKGIVLSDEALTFIAATSAGDARQALTSLELILETARPEESPLQPATIREILQRRSLLYDKSGEEHFNVISALHKSIRNSDVDASLYWLVRMLEGGEDPLYLARRLIRASAEDIGLADPEALRLAVAAKDAVHFIGMPEGGVVLAELVVYLAQAPKSNAVYRAYGDAVREIREGENPPVPPQIRNAPTRLMKDLGYGRGYQYAHDFDEQVTAMSCLPESLEGRRFYQPTEAGREKEIADRIKQIERTRNDLRRKT